MVPGGRLELLWCYASTSFALWAKTVLAPRSWSIPDRGGSQWGREV